MLEKKGRGENFEEEYKKYETIIEVEKFNNEYKDFIDTIKQNSNSNNKINEERKSSNLKYDSEPKKISLEVIKKYLRILKQLNKKMYKSDILLSKEDCKLLQKNNDIKTDEELEELEVDIIKQVENYNKESN